MSENVPRAEGSAEVSEIVTACPLVLQGTQARIGEYDLRSGCCLATATISSPPEKLAYSRDGRLIIALLEDRSLVAFLDQLSKSQTLLPGNSKHVKNPARFHVAVSVVCMAFSFSLNWPLRLCKFSCGGLPNCKMMVEGLSCLHICVVQGVRPLIFLAQHYGAAVRIAYIPGEVTPGKSGSPPRQGLQMKTDRKLPIAALATHPSRAPFSFPTRAVTNVILSPYMFSRIA